MIAIMVAVFFSAINQTIIGVVMPRIIAKLGGMDCYTWVITIYLQWQLRPSSLGNSRIFTEENHLY